MFGDPYLVWHEGADFTDLLEAARSDRRAVAHMLTAGIAMGDPLAAESFTALAAAGLAPNGAEALLCSAVATAAGGFLVRLAQALHALTGDQSWAGQIASVLTTGESWSERIDAAIALAQFNPTEYLVRTLAHAVCDPEYLVRYHAANTLLRYAGNARNVEQHPEIFRKIKTPATGTPSAADRAVWQHAAGQLAAKALPRTAPPTGADSA
jgi:hypothetical protein